METTCHEEEEEEEEEKKEKKKRFTGGFSIFTMARVVNSISSNSTIIQALTYFKHFEWIMGKTKNFKDWTLPTFLRIQPSA